MPKLRLLLVSLIYLFFAALLFGTVWHHAIVAERCGIVQMVDGTAHNPFARRALIPTLTKIVHAILPEALDR
jgi:hypothetical protein